MRGLTNIEGIYFLGIGGIGMSALARYFLSQDYIICGYDRTRSKLTDALTEEGCIITYEDSIDSLPVLFSEPSGNDRVLIVYTPAIPGESILLNFFRNNGYTIYKRAEILGVISGETDAIAVAGTHGKTTVSTMTAHWLSSSPVGCSAFLGGISVNYNTNLLLSESRYTVMEADEFDRSFLHLSPLIAVVTAIDPDHLDIYGTAESMVEAYEEFCHRVRPGGTLILNENIASSLSLPGDVNIYTYGTGAEASFRAESVRKEEGSYTFDIITPGESVRNVRIHLPGMVNILNATAASAAAWCAGVSPEIIRSAVGSYRGVRRRFDVRYSGNDIIYIDDYAHHPQEINALVSAVRDFWPGKHVTGIFQPHLYSRTRDFADGFAEALSRLDEIILLTLYPAREMPIPGVSSDMIAGMMKNRNVKVVTKEELLPALNSVKKGLLLTIGAGDIDRFVEPITEMLKSRNV
ncbi:MAG: UDP-N-acetylmuramate--L-alanine ligase [Bacteroidales bacterium]|jgi:UDP-N-acetylmuramate--alanine ligase